MSLLRAFKKEDFCSEEHRSAYRTENDRLALQRLSADRTPGANANRKELLVTAKTPPPPKKIITASDVLLAEPEASNYLVEDLPPHAIDHLAPLPSHPAAPDLTVSLPEPAGFGRFRMRSHPWIEGVEIPVGEGLAFPPEPSLPAEPRLASPGFGPQLGMLAACLSTEWTPPAAPPADPPFCGEPHRLFWAFETASPRADLADPGGSRIPPPVASPAWRADLRDGSLAQPRFAGCLPWAPEVPSIKPSFSEIVPSGLAVDLAPALLAPRLTASPIFEAPAEIPLEARAMAGTYPVSHALWALAGGEGGLMAAGCLERVPASLQPPVLKAFWPARETQGLNYGDRSAWTLEPRAAAPAEIQAHETGIGAAGVIAATLASPVPPPLVWTPRSAGLTASIRLVPLALRLHPPDAAAPPRYRQPLPASANAPHPAWPRIEPRACGLRIRFQLKPALWVDGLRPVEADPLAARRSEPILNLGDPAAPVAWPRPRDLFPLARTSAMPPFAAGMQRLSFSPRAERGPEQAGADQAALWKSQEPVLQPKLRVQPDPPSPRGQRKRKLEGWGPAFKAPAISKGFWKQIPSDIRWVALAIPLVLAITWYSLTPRGKAFAREGDKPIAKVDTSFLTRGMQAIEASISQRAAVELSDDFRRGLAAWQGDGAWSDGWAYDEGGFVRPGALALLRPSLELTDYKFELLGSIERRGFGWVYRAKDTKNYQAGKLVVVRPGPLPQVALVRYRVVNGREQGRTQVVLPLSVRNETVYRVRVDVQGANFTTSVLGQVVDTYTDPAHPSGGVGLFAARGEAARVRWVEVSHQYDMIGRLCAMLVPYGVTAPQTSTAP